MKLSILKRRTAALLAAFTLVVPAAGLATTEAPTAYAEDDTGGTGGGGGNGTMRTFRWAFTATNPSATAWENFRSHAINTFGGYDFVFEYEVNRRTHGDIAICKNSRVIWFLAGGNGWGYNYQGPTHGPGWDSNFGTIENPYYLFSGIAPLKGQVAAFKQWDKLRNGNLINRTPGYTIVCSGGFEPLPDETYDVTTTTSSNFSDSLKETHRYSCAVEVKRQISAVRTDKNGNRVAYDPIGVDNLHDQGGAARVTNFGRLYDQVRRDLSSGKLKWTAATIADYRKKVQAALAADSKLNCSTVALDAKNKMGMAEGGVLNVIEQSKNATIVMNSKTTVTSTQVCPMKRTWNMSTYSYNAPVANGKCRTSKTSVTTGSGSAPLDVQKNTGFWQMLSVHCNQEDFDKLVAAAGASVQASGDPTKKIAALAYSRRYSEAPDSMDFGDKFNSNGAKAASGKLSFYDKECPYDCTSGKGPDATPKNGASFNVGSTTPAGGSMDPKGYGAQANKSNTNKFQFFRDNSDHSIVLDVWYPKDSAVVDYRGNAPKSTTFTRWAEGTPAIASSTDSKVGTSLAAKQGNALVPLFTGSSGASNQKNWAVNSYSDSLSTLLPGLAREVVAKANWASEPDKPHVLTAKWEYAPVVKTTVPTVVGFGQGSSLLAQSPQALAANVDGKCYASFGKTTGPNTVKLFHDNTGSDVTNNLDGKLLSPAGAGKPQDDGSNLFITFIRAASE